MKKHTILPQVVEFLQIGKIKYEVEQSVLYSWRKSKDSKIEKSPNVRNDE